MGQFGDYWKSESFEGGRYEIYPKDGYFTAGASAITRPLNIPFAHRIVRIEFTHLDGSNALNTDALYLEVRMNQTRATPPNRQCTIFREYDIIAKDGIEPFGDAFEYPARIWDVLLDSTTNHRIIIVFVIQRLH